MDPDEVATGEIETVALRGWQQHGILRPLADSSCYNCQNLALMANCGDCCCSVEENLWPAGSPIAKPATSANGSNCLYKLTITFGFFLLVKEEMNPHPVPNWACNEELTLALSLP